MNCDLLDFLEVSPSYLIISRLFIEKLKVTWVKLSSIKYFYFLTIHQDEKNWISHKVERIYLLVWVIKTVQLNLHGSVVEIKELN